MTTVTSLRRIPTPRSEPPYDEDSGGRLRGEEPTPAPWVQGSLALVLPVTAAPPAAPPPRRRTPLRLVPDPDDEEPRSVPTEDGDDEVDCHHAIPQVHRPWVARLAQALLEALTGERPYGQLLPWTSDQVFAAVAKQARRHARTRPQTAPTRRAPGHARTVRVDQPRPEVAEVCALVRRGPRTQAIALRLEAHRGRWRCTAFELA